MRSCRRTRNLGSWNIFSSFMILLLAFLLFPVLTMAARGGEPGKPDAEDEGGNNLSFPVIWAEGVRMPLPGEMPGTVESLEGEWWYWWGIEGEDPNNYEIKSCAPDPDDNAYCDDGEEPGCPPDPDNDVGLGEDYCDDGIDGTVNADQVNGSGPNDPNLVRAYLQKDPDNIWQADNMDWSEIVFPEGVDANPLIVDSIDWGDSLESVDWNTRSQVRTEVVLYKDLDTPMIEYGMRHVSGWGIAEVHGLAVKGTLEEELDGEQATIYTPCARLTIQKLLTGRDDPALDEALSWDDADHLWTTAIGDDLVNDPIFNHAVYENEGYAAEVNVKGKIIYGYTWNVRKLNDAIVNGGTAAGDYRVTFSFDDECGLDADELPVFLNTYFEPDTTDILLPLEDEPDTPEAVVTEGDETNNETGGGTAIIDFDNNLTYIDVRIVEKSGGKDK